MTGRGAWHPVPSIPATCSVCGGSFLAKSSQARVCQTDACQREARRVAAARRYVARKVRVAA